MTCLVVFPREVSRSSQTVSRPSLERVVQESVKETSATTFQTLSFLSETDFLQQPQPGKTFCINSHSPLKLLKWHKPVFLYTILLYQKLRLLSHRVHLGPEGPSSGGLLSLHWPDPDGAGLSALQCPSLARSDGYLPHLFKNTEMRGEYPTAMCVGHSVGQVCEVQRSASEIHRAPVQICLTGTVTVSTKVQSCQKDTIRERKKGFSRGEVPQKQTHL
jgi:hypothetical protein